MKRDWIRGEGEIQLRYEQEFLPYADDASTPTARRSVCYREDSNNPPRVLPVYTHTHMFRTCLSGALCCTWSFDRDQKREGGKLHFVLSRTTIVGVAGDNAGACNKSQMLHRQWYVCLLLAVYVYVCTRNIKLEYKRRCCVTRTDHGLTQERSPLAYG